MRKMFIFLALSSVVLLTMLSFFPKCIRISDYIDTEHH